MILKPGAPLRGVVPRPAFIALEDGKLSIAEDIADEFSTKAWLPNAIRVQDGEGAIYESSIYNKTEYCGFDTDPAQQQTWILSADSNDEAPSLILEVSCDTTKLTLLMDF